jgi:hypothetical protein
MIINLLDPGLGGAEGHHHDWNTRIVNRLSALGHEVSVYAAAQAHPASLRGFENAVRVERLFEMNPYKNKLDFDPICGEIQRQILGTRTIARDLGNVAPADLWLWPTAFAYQMRGCAMIDTKAAMSFCIHTPPDNGTGLPRHAETGAWWRLATKSLSAAGHRILTVGAVERECMSALLNFIGDLDPKHLPMPIDGMPGRHNELRTIGFLGAQRDDHGRLLLGQLIARSLEAGFKVLTQRADTVPASLRKHPGLTVLDFEGDFPSKVEACDLLVAPYRWDAYVAGRSSGVIWQAIASGVPCVAPFNTCPGRSLASVGSGVFFSEFTTASVFDAVVQAQRLYPSLADAAFHGATEYAKHNGLDRFVEAMITGGKNQML